MENSAFGSLIFWGGNCRDTSAGVMYPVTRPWNSTSGAVIGMSGSVLREGEGGGGVEIYIFTL